MPSSRSSGRSARESAAGASPSPGTAPGAPDPAQPFALSAPDQAALLAATRRVMLALTRPAQTARLFQIVAEEATVLLGASAAALCLVTDEGDALRVRAGTGALADLEGTVLPVEGSFTGLAIGSGAPHETHDLRSDPRGYGPREHELPAGPALAVPLRTTERALGSLLVIRGPGGDPFAGRAVLLAGAAAESFSAALANSRAFEQARGSRAEMEAWRRQAELRIWTARYEEVATADRKVVFAWNVATDALQWGSSLEPVFGYRAEEFGGTIAEWAAHLHGEDRDRVLAGMREAADSQAPFRLECRLLHGGSSYRRIVVRGGSPVPAPDGPYVIGAVDDMTDRDRMASERERQARHDVVRDLVRALRHEINNPLAVVMGQAQLLQTEPVVNGDPLLRQSVTAIYEEGGRMEELMKRLAALETAPREPLVDGQGGLNLPPPQS